MELLDIYDIKGNKLNKTIDRANKKDLAENEYIKIVSVWIKSDHKYLIQYCSKEKGNIYNTTGGHVSSGNSSLQQAIIETKEEIGLDLKESDLTYLGQVIRPNMLFDVYIHEDETQELINHTFDLQKEEVEEICWLSKNDIEDLILKNIFKSITAEGYFKFIKNS